MGAEVHRLTMIVMIVLGALHQMSFSAPSEKLPLPHELQADLPWFGFDAMDAEGTYNNVVNNAKLKELAKERKSRRIVFCFFATWCLPCRAGLKLMGDYSAELERNGVLVVLVNVAEQNVENYNYGKIDAWAKQYMKAGWLLVFDQYSNSLEDFGLLGKDGAGTPLPRTLVSDVNLKPIMLIGEEGSDYPQILWSDL